MRLYDVTLPLVESLPVWPGDPPVCLEQLFRVEEGAPYTLSRLSLSVHAGTHVDAPAHYLAGGATAESLALSVLVGDALVLDVSGERAITGAQLERMDTGQPTARLLLKTGWAARLRSDGFSAMADFLALRLDAAEWLTSHGIRLVGIESPSVERFDDGDDAPVHRHLLGAQVVIVEGLDLTGVAPGPYMVACLPLLLVGSDGAPARVILWREG